MYVIVLTSPDSADVYDITPETDNPPRGIANYVVSLDLNDVVGNDWVVTLPRQLLGPWQQFVHRVFGNYEIRGEVEHCPRVYDAAGNELTFAQLLSRATDLFAEVADIV